MCDNVRVNSLYSIISRTAPSVCKKIYAMEEQNVESCSHSEDEDEEIDVISTKIEGDFYYHAFELERLLHLTGENERPGTSNIIKEEVDIPEEIVEEPQQGPSAGVKEEVDTPEEEEEIIVVDDIIHRRCVVCRKKMPQKYKKAKWFECIDDFCDKILCHQCKTRSTKIKRKTVCISCGAKYLAGPASAFRQCKQCRYWRCKRCCGISRCRCLLKHVTSQHHFRNL